MKKRSVILSGLLAFSLMAAVPVLAEETDQGEADVQVSETELLQEDILGQIEQANTPDSTLEKNGDTGIHTIYYDSEGNETYSDYVYIGENAFVYENSHGDVDVLQDGEGYGFSSEENLPYAYCFLDESSYENFLRQNQENYISADFSGEELVSEEEQDGVTVVTTEIAGKDVSDPYTSLLFHEGDGLKFVYTVDAATRLLQSQECYEVQEDGTELLLASTVMDTEPEVYEVSPELMDQIDNEDSRTITFVIDPGTEQEQTVVKTVGKGCAVTLVQPEGYTGLYTDEDCTQVYEEENYTEDATIYMAKGK